ncbi:hypothetical protein DN752_21930 [Echinicola strongylocentroti]|uniref:Outer membrane protein beta-barrel domain-containing protein n=1 Tax=Echinicola strongylocentroti TaxID=1795355 RepID=A0A2Z4IQL4_9BACT|nr:outer membrane beta-barrel protein [Echinicola strongylocentroti]AWW32593.1 hypothetical protein DN752_21930 [Echinicola strongylocentroti]
MRRILLLFAFILGISSPSFAQIEFNNLGIGVSYWLRSYSGMDERGFLPDYPGEGGFSKGAIMPSISGELTLTEKFALDGRVGFWRGQFSGETQFSDGRVLSGKNRQTIVPVSLGLMYVKDDIDYGNVRIFGGIGANQYLIHNDVEMFYGGGEGATYGQPQTAIRYGYYAKLGMEYFLTYYISVGFDFRYNGGKYYQQGVNTEEVYQVDIKGPEAGFSLHIHFDDEF